MSGDAKILRKTKASFESVLVDAGFAALILLRRTNNRGTTYFFGSAITDDEGIVSSYFLVSATKDATLEYFLGRSDLHYIFVYAQSSSYYTAKADQIFSKEVELTPFSGEVHEDWVPSKGFFARDHNVKYNFIKQPSSTHHIPIDGQWLMDEFQEFYSRYADLYVFQEALRSIKGKVLESIKATYVSAFRGKPFRGGSSYLSFFADLKSALPFHERPQLAAVQWASPGEIRIKGSTDLFEKVEAQVAAFQRDYEEAKAAHKQLREYMQKKGWLEITSAEYSMPSADETRELSAMIEVLSQKLHTPGGRGFAHILGGNQIVEAKIFLSVFRRLESVLQFVREGRVAFGG